MSDEFDDLVDPLPIAPAAPLAVRFSAGRDGRAARLIARLWGASSLSLRARLVACLVRPLSPLGLAAVAAGAFTVFLARAPGGLTVAMGDAARFSKEQIAELARFVEQVSPEALQQVAGLLADNAFGVGTFAASAALLLLLEVKRGQGAAAAARRPRG
ncbi:MAG: hypothetical protein ABI364_03735 [Caldimonas sp.]